MNPLLKGCALVVDDEIENSNSRIYKMIQTLEKECMFVKLKQIPSKKAIANLSNISYIILDWNIAKTLPEGVSGGRELEQHQKDINVAFIDNVLKKFFIPIFVFTQLNIDEINAVISENETLDEAKRKNRLIIMSKKELEGEKVTEYLNNWLNQNKTVLALKMFEEQLVRSKNSFLVEMGGLSSDWINVVYNTIYDEYEGVNDDDGKLKPQLVNHELNEFLINSLLSRIHDVAYDTVGINVVDVDESDEKKIYESIKFFRYERVNDINNAQAYEGDLYQKTNGDGYDEFLINITPRCDLLRKNWMLLLRGTGEDRYEKPTVNTFCIEMILGKEALKFKYDDMIKMNKPKDNDNDLSKITYCDTDYKRIGRIVHPYITAIRNDFAHFISRQGTPRHPKNKSKMKNNSSKQKT